ncbi:TOBE domain-containing protein [Halomicrococcus sp. NG-SE-24]|uniref:TOBE domain-containing protein n=1 Tax=Halomicrococcus sp. NG-SE-24 TaxID=3436928 RepID=UPI003D997F99
MDVQTKFDTYIGSDGVALDARDVALLQAIDSNGSLNAAADDLGRSYGHSQRRIVELEEAFGSLVERQRGGTNGGGSTLTETAEKLLAQFERAQTGFKGVAEITENVLTGTITERDGELATVETTAGLLRALIPQDSDGEVELMLRADAVTVNDPADVPLPENTSARNRFNGTIVDIEDGERIHRIAVDINADDPLAVIITEDSREKLGLAEGSEVVVSFKATAIRGIPV